jgi:membrane protein YqaA with SNARE-associated domain
MELSEAYSFLFFDSIISSLAIPINMRLVFPTMQTFGGYSPYLMAIVATIGSLLGHAANFGLGRFVLIATKYNPQNNSEKARKFFDLCRKYGGFLLVLSWVPVFGPFLSLAVGFVKVPVKLVFSTIFAAHFVYYCFISLT